MWKSFTIMYTFSYLSGINKVFGFGRSTGPGIFSFSTWLWKTSVCAECSFHAVCFHWWYRRWRQSSSSSRFRILKIWDPAHVHFYRKFTCWKFQSIVTHMHAAYLFIFSPFPAPNIHPPTPPPPPPPPPHTHN